MLVGARVEDHDPALKLVKPTRPPSSMMSSSGTRPQSRTLLGDQRMASSTMCGGT